MTTMLEQGQKVLRGELTPPPIACLLGFVLKSIEPGHAVFELEADERHHNPMGTLHGGVYCDLADAAMGYAYAATLGEGETFTTIELKINFLRAVRKATLTAEALYLHNSQFFVTCSVARDWAAFNGGGSLVNFSVTMDRPQCEGPPHNEGSGEISTRA